MIKLYYWPGACSLAPHLVLEDIGDPFELVLVDFASAEQRQEAFLQLNPKGRVPLLIDGTFRLTENPAILRYLAIQRPDSQLWPRDQQGDARCCELLAWIASSVHAMYSHVTRPERYADGAAAREAVRDKGRQTTLALWRDIEAHLRASPWAVGDRISVADFYLLVVWSWARERDFVGAIGNTFPAWTEHALRLAERASVQRAFRSEGLAVPGEQAGAAGSA
ncbi:glutathione S-transferase family protein [Xanthobacteraceae bacterium A53D]